MNELIRSVRELVQSPVKKKVIARLDEFEAFKNKDADEWFSELCFCILTANSKQSTAILIQEAIGAKGFINHSEDQVRSVIMDHKHRFHNNKTSFIIKARPYAQSIKNTVEALGEEDSREWIVKNIKGLGYKEASHFLRNTGAKGLAILDRHILRVMEEHKIIPERPKSLTRKLYLDIEQKFNAVAKSIGISPAELDMYIWHMKVNDVFK